MNKEKEYIEVPVLVGFDCNERIGTLKVLKDSLPEIPNFHFSIGYIEEPFELVCISATPDTLFVGSTE